jgi:hypothetical protein
MRFGYVNNKIILCLTAMFLFLAITLDVCADSAAVRVINTADSGEINFVVRNVSGDNPAQGGLITWSNVVAGETGWKIADQYIEISHSDLPEFWGMQIYTDNKNEDVANPQYTGKDNPAGLIKTDNTILTLPMAWRITDFVINPDDDLNKPVQRPDATGFTNYMWHFLKDKNTPDNTLTRPDESFINAEEYVTLWNQSGIAWNEGGRSGNPKKAYIYLAANFTMSSASAEYQTTALTLEAYHGISPFPIYIYKDAPLTDYPDEPGATLENHYAPSGWINYKEGAMTIDSKWTDKPYSGSHCLKISWNGIAGADGGKWAGLAWLEPADKWDKGAGTGNGYDLRGANSLSFWARTDDFSYVEGKDLKIAVGFGSAEDSCKEIAAIFRSPALITDWQKYIIVFDRDMSRVSNGFTIIFNDQNTPRTDNKCNIYLDDIKFDKF